MIFTILFSIGFLFYPIFQFMFSNGFETEQENGEAGEAEFDNIGD